MKEVKQIARKRSEIKALSAYMTNQDRTAYVADAVKAVGVDPFRELALLSINARSEHVRCQAAAELAQYLAPRLKAIELEGNKEVPFQFIMNLHNQVDNLNAGSGNQNIQRNKDSERLPPE